MLRPISIILKVRKMPISICENEEQVTKWCETFVKKGRFVVYYTTDDYEVILEPVKTTRPIRYCYIKMLDLISAKRLSGQLAVMYSLDRVELKGMSWDIEKGPWIKIPLEK